MLAPTTNEKELMNGNPMVSIPNEHHEMLIGMAAASVGRTTARRIAGGGLEHPGDQLGTILCEAWRVEDWKASSAMLSYMVALRDECDELEVTPPAFTEVLRWLHLAINTARFPDVDVEKMRRKLGLDVPAMAGQSI